MKNLIIVKGKQYKLIKHPKYKWMLPRYISRDGIVITPQGKELKIHRAKKKSKAAFVRMCGQKKDVSLTVGQLVLIAWLRNPKDGEIAVHKEGMEDKLNNLFWGTRKDQSAIAMKNPENYKRVSKIHLNSSFRSKLSPDKVNKIKRLSKEKVPIKSIAEILKISYSCAYKYL